MRQKSLVSTPGGKLFRLFIDYLLFYIGAGSPLRACEDDNTPAFGRMIIKKAAALREVPAFKNRSYNSLNILI